MGGRDGQADRQRDNSTERQKERGEHTQADRQTEERRKGRTRERERMRRNETDRKANKLPSDTPRATGGNCRSLWKLVFPFMFGGIANLQKGEGKANDWGFGC